jgi:hypothetical protein
VGLPQGGLGEMAPGDCFPWRKALLIPRRYLPRNYAPIKIQQSSDICCSRDPSFWRRAEGRLSAQNGFATKRPPFLVSRKGFGVFTLLSLFLISCAFVSALYGLYNCFETTRDGAQLFNRLAGEAKASLRCCFLSPVPQPLLIPSFWFLSALESSLLDHF